MSNTRHATDGSVLRQERYMSSTEYERGRMANVVAHRCSKLDDPQDRELIWFLQLLSHQGGLKAVADALWQRWPGRLATRSMVAFGIKPSTHYTDEQVRVIRMNGGDCGFADEFGLRGDLSFADLLDDREERVTRPGDKRPTFYTLEQIRQKLRAYAGTLPEFLERICIDPACRFDDAWYFHDLRGALCEFLADWMAARLKGQAITEIGRQVNETLDYCLESGRLVIVDGLARTGKTFATKAWCEQHPGRVRYVQVPSTADDTGFFRAIAVSLGTSININSKSHELRDRVEDTLRRSGLMVVFDEGHYILPQGNNREAMPSRLNWILTALVNHGVPVAIVTTPQFMRAQKRVEQKTCWTSEQFVGRVGHYQRLPDSLSDEDLAAVARVQLPEGDRETIQKLVLYAGGSAKYLAGIEAVVSRARFLVKRQARTKVTLADIKRAIQDSAIPSDNALSAALADTGRSGRNKQVSIPVQPALTAPESRLKTPAPAREISTSVTRQTTLPAPTRGVEPVTS